MSRRLHHRRASDRHQRARVQRHRRGGDLREHDEWIATCFQHSEALLDTVPMRRTMGILARATLEFRRRCHDARRSNLRQRPCRQWPALWGSSTPELRSGRSHFGPGCRLTHARAASPQSLPDRLFVDDLQWAGEQLGRSSRRSAPSTTTSTANGPSAQGPAHPLANHRRLHHHTAGSLTRLMVSQR